MGYSYSNMLVELQAINYAFKKNSISIFTDNYITADHFDTYKQHFEWLMSFVKEYGTMPNKETFAVQFKDSEAKFEWLEVEESEQYIVDMLREGRMFREAHDVFNNAGKMFTTNKSSEAIQYMVEQGKQILGQVPDNDVDLIADAHLRLENYIDRVENPTANFVTSGLKELDAVLGGGWDLKNDTVAICARTGLGKSWMLVKFAAAAVQKGFNVGYYSGEMESDLIGYRLDTFLGNIPNGSLTHGNAEVREQYEMYVRNLPTTVRGKFICCTPDTFGGIPTVDMIEAFVEKNHINFLCIDQLSLLNDSKHAKTPREQFVNISKDLRAMQRLHKFPILFAVQLNRESTDDTGGPSTKNIAESDRIGQDATQVIFLERKEENLVITLGKSRNAKSGSKLTYKWSVNTGILKFLSDEEDAMGGVEAQETLNAFTNCDDEKSDCIF